MKPTAVETPSIVTDREIGAAIAAERQRLLELAGLTPEAPVRHYRRPHERPFSPADRATTTVLIGGMSSRHDRLIRASLEGLGYRVACIPTPRKADLQQGRAVCNYGLCNPSYFIAGALVNYLRELRGAGGMPLPEILDRYVFLTAGSCGPCRAGMYEDEYRLALRNAGFAGFRVLAFRQTGELHQSGSTGMEMDARFFLALFNAFIAGDLLNDLAHQILPYALDRDGCAASLDRCVTVMCDALRAQAAVNPGVSFAGWLAHLFVRGLRAEDASVLARQLRPHRLLKAARRCAELLNREVRVDYLRPRPVMKITGEFWAQTTDGDGNYNMFSFLEGEGAEVLVEPVATWINYLIHRQRVDARDRRGIVEGRRPGPLGRLASTAGFALKWLTLTAGEWFVRRAYRLLLQAFGGTTLDLAPMPALQAASDPFYSMRLDGGEGPLEVAKNIWYTQQSLAHAVVSLKPFGCMPSSQSDAVQAAVVSRFPQMNFLAVETSGDNEISVLSRVQMCLGEARLKAETEWQAALGACRHPLEALRAFVRSAPELSRPIQPLPRRPGIAGRAASFALHVDELMSRRREPHLLARNG